MNKLLIRNGFRMLIFCAFAAIVAFACAENEPAPVDNGGGKAKVVYYALPG